MKRGFVAIYYYRKKLALPEISYYLSQGRSLIHICIVKKELSKALSALRVLHLKPTQQVWCSLA